MGRNFSMAGTEGRRSRARERRRLSVDLKRPLFVATGNLGPFALALGKSRKRAGFCPEAMDTHNILCVFVPRTLQIVCFSLVTHKCLLY